MIKLCIFDMDGTVSNTINSIAYFANNALTKAGLPTIGNEVYKKIVGNGAKVLVERMLKTVGADECYYDEVAHEYNTKYDADFLYLTEPYDGIIDMLNALKEKGIKTAILSNKPHGTACKVSDALFGDSLVDVCYGGRDEIPLKPDPAGVFEIMNQFNVSKEECLYIGDTGTDMKTGKGAGLYTIGVLWGFRDFEELKKNNADSIISNPNEILEIIEQLNNNAQ